MTPALASPPDFHHVGRSGRLCQDSKCGKMKSIDQGGEFVNQGMTSVSSKL